MEYSVIVILPLHSLLCVKYIDVATQNGLKYIEIMLPLCSIVTYYCPFVLFCSRSVAQTTASSLRYMANPPSLWIQWKNAKRTAQPLQLLNSKLARSVSVNQPIIVNSLTKMTLSRCNIRYIVAISACYIAVKIPSSWVLFHDVFYFQTLTVDAE